MTKSGENQNKLYDPQYDEDGLVSKDWLFAPMSGGKPDELVLAGLILSFEIRTLFNLHKIPLLSKEEWLRPVYRGWPALHLYISHLGTWPARQLEIEDMTKEDWFYSSAPNRPALFELLNSMNSNYLPRFSTELLSSLSDAEWLTEAIPDTPNPETFLAMFLRAWQNQFLQAGEKEILKAKYDAETNSFEQTGEIRLLQIRFNDFCTRLATIPPHLFAEDMTPHKTCFTGMVEYFCRELEAEIAGIFPWDWLKQFSKEDWLKAGRFSERGDKKTALGVLLSSFSYRRGQEDLAQNPHFTAFMDHVFSLVDVREQFLQAESKYLFLNPLFCHSEVYRAFIGGLTTEDLAWINPLAASDNTNLLTTIVDERVIGLVRQETLDALSSETWLCSSPNHASAFALMITSGHMSRVRDAVFLDLPKGYWAAGDDAKSPLRSETNALNLTYNRRNTNKGGVITRRYPDLERVLALYTKHRRADKIAEMIQGFKVERNPNQDAIDLCTRHLAFAKQTRQKRLEF